MLSDQVYYAAIDAADRFRALQVKHYGAKLAGGSAGIVTRPARG